MYKIHTFYHIYVLYPYPYSLLCCMIVILFVFVAVDRSLASGMSDARDAMINAATDMLGAFSQTIPAAQRMGSLLCPFPLRLMPLYTLALLKSVSDTSI